MSGDANGWSPELQRYLDGEPAEGLDARARAEADRFRETVARYVASVETPGAELDEAVMAAVRARVAPAGPPFRRRLLALLSTPVRPALAAAMIAVLVVGVGTALALRLGLGDADRTSKIAPLELTIPVEFQLDLPDAGTVSLAGSFNNWDADATPLARQPGTGRWVATLRLAPGWHEYLFVVDGIHWIPDPTTSTRIVSGQGDTSSAIYVGPP